MKQVTGKHSQQERCKNALAPATKVVYYYMKKTDGRNK